MRRTLPSWLLLAAVVALAVWVRRLVAWTGWRAFSGRCGHKAPCYRCGSTVTVADLTGYQADERTRHRALLVEQGGVA